MPGITGTPAAAADIRSRDYSSLDLTPDQHERLRGRACARCGGREGLEAGGHAYTLCRGGGRLGWPVKVCVSCRQSGASR